MSDVLAALRRIVRRAVGDFRFERVWPASVEANDGDTVDLLPDDLEMRGLGLQRVSVAQLAPETGLRIELGTRCLLGFTAGDPRKPVVVAWEWSKGSAVVSLAGGVAAVARKGDLVGVLLPAGSATGISGIISGVIQPPGAPPPPTIPIPPGTALTGGLAVLPSAPYGVILGGAPRVKA